MEDGTTKPKQHICTGGVKMEDEKEDLKIYTSDNVANDNWQRYMYGIDRGHRAYTESARFLDGYYLGGQYDGEGNLQAGGHWSEADLELLSLQRRPAYEFNQIMPALNSAFGYQISNRLDISFRPRSGAATQKLAESRSKVAMQIANNNKLYWSESEVFQDGMIQQRGYFDIRMDFDDSIQGELSINVLDPMDVIPDPDAKSYNPKQWSDVIVSRWLTFDEIEGLYGKEIRDKAEETASYNGDQDFGDLGDYDSAERSKFAATADAFRSGNNTHGERRIRIIDRQRWVREVMDVAMYPGGDIRQLNGDEIPEVLEQMQQSGAIITKRRTKRVRWSVSTKDTTLHDNWSPYDRFTVVPFFPYFRRGKTRGMVDNAIGPAKALDKGISQAVHIINTTANSGWQMEQNQLTNMSSSQLEEKGATTGLVLERKTGTPPLMKITSNTMPHGIDRIIEIASMTLGEVTVPPAMRGIGAGDEPGIAIQSRQHAAQQQLAVPLDNLARTRNMVADWIDYAIGKYYTAERTLRITKTDPATGKELDDTLTINQQDETGAMLNDMTSGEYETVVTEQPMQVTFENSQFTQAIEMRDKGIAIPDAAIIRKSNLSDKAEIIEQMQSSTQPAPDPLIEARMRLLEAQARKTDADAAEKNVTGMFSATSAANQIALNPTIAPVADAMWLSAGGKDANSAPAIPEPQGAQGIEGMPHNTSPNFPPTPASGIMDGIETGPNL